MSNGDQAIIFPREGFQDTEVFDSQIIKERPSWDEIWIETASTLAKRSLDPRFQVGVIIVTDDNTQVLAVGYNGDHRGGPNLVDSFEPGQSGFIHAEINALIKCDYNNPKRKKMYLTVSTFRPQANRRRGSKTCLKGFYKFSIRSRVD